MKKSKIEKFFFNCSLCESKSFSKIYGVSIFNVCLCPNCGLVCLNPRMDEKGYMGDYIKSYSSECFGDSLADPVDAKKLYDDIEKKPGPMKVFNDLKKYLSPESKIIDIGCGVGGNLAVLKKNKFNYLTGLEPAPDCCKRLQNFYDIECFSRSLSEFAQDFKQKKKFDCIILDQVIEHFVEPEKALEMISSLIKPEGILYIRTPDFYRFSNPLSQFCIPHTFYFSDVTLKMLLRNYGFIVKEYFESLIPHEMVLLAVKKETADSRQFDTEEPQRVLSYLKKDKVIYAGMMIRRLMEEFVITVFGENAYLALRNFLKKCFIKIIKRYS